MGLDTVELVMTFEKEFGITIPDSAAANMHTPRDVAVFVSEERSRLLRPMSESEIARQIKEIVIRHLGIAETDYSEHKRFIEDFGAD